LTLGALFRQRGASCGNRHEIFADAFMKISVIFGTRPEAIKLAPVILACRRSAHLDCQVCVTAQHREMLDQVMQMFGIQPDVDLDLMQPGQSLAALTARSLEALDAYLAAETPDLVLVQGDTTSVLCATLAAFYRKVAVGHVEAGLRTGNLQAPWPEEANRVLTSRLAALHFAPTEQARQNLLIEGIPSERIRVTGNTVIDALFLALEAIRKHSPVIPGLPEYLQPTRTHHHGIGPPSDAGAQIPRLVLITGHRRESFGAGFESICRAIAELAARFPEVHFVYPVHLNPQVREPVFRILSVKMHRAAELNAGKQNIHLIEPLSYLNFVALMERASIVLTDSGGIQEEAPSLGKPVLVMRDTTERPEALATGLVKLVGTECARIVSETEKLLHAEVQRVDSRRENADAAGHFPNPYGDGKAAERIVAQCAEYLDECVART
jgi:UDP-N-acetylglucosamine 2-epimerase (non-hydrolysing)